MGQHKKIHFNTVERITFLMGLAVLVSIIIYLTFLISQHRTDPPQLVITTKYQPAMAHNAYEIRVENEGEETAVNASINLSLYQDGKSVETSTVNINFVPIESEEVAWIVFYSKRKPSDSLVISSVTYVKP